MRCPKCGFISFDHLTSCAKCGRDIGQVAAELQGTTIKVETPMFLSGALAAFSESGGSFDEHAMEGDIDQGVDFDMEMETEGEEPATVAEAEAEIDFSFEEEAEKVGGAEEPEISFAGMEAEETGGVEEEAEAGADIQISMGGEEEPEIDEADESFEELDFMGAADEEEEGGLEFDLEDFMEDMDHEESSSSGSEDVSEIDIDLGKEEK
jgi:hypothetical protein